MSSERRRTHRRTTLLAIPGILLASLAFLAPAAVAADDRVDLSSVAAIKAFLQSEGYTTTNAVVQEGFNNYAGTNCPGAGWTCSNPPAGRVVIQRASGAGQNKFEGTGSLCVVAQTATTGANTASCVQKSSKTGVNVDAFIVQQDVTGNNSSTLSQNSTLASGNTQSLGQRGRVHQQIVGSGTGSNSSSVDQRLSMSVDSPGPVTQTQLSSQFTDVDQFTYTGPSNSAITQNLTQRANSSAGSVTQKQNASGTVPYTESSVTQRSDTGNQTSTLNVRTDQQAVVNPAASTITQIQGCPGCGVKGSLDQQSAGISTQTANLSERQHLVANGGTNVQQTQYGPVGVPPDVPGPSIEPVDGVRCCSDQLGNPNNSFTIAIDSDQNAKEDADQFNYVRGSCNTSGSCNVGLAITQDGVNETHDCSGQECNIAIRCLNDTTCSETDTAAPNTTITSAPSGVTSSSSATFTFTGTEPGGFICALDEEPWAVCSSPRTYTGLGEGSHLFRVSAFDIAENVDQTPAETTWTIDTTPPDTVIDSAPSGFTNATSGTITFHATEAGATFECRIDGGAWSACTSPKTFTGLGNGSHTAEVRALDSLGNPDATPAAATWTVDTGAPTSAFTTASGSTHIGNPPGSDSVEGTADDTLSGVQKVTVTFTTALMTRTVEATLTCNADRTHCTWRAGIPGLPPGQYTVTKQAFDRAGNSDTPSSITIFVI